jgi:hypothetical protein
MRSELSYSAIDAIRVENRDINIASINDKRLMRLFDESGRIISNYVDNLYPLRESDIARLEELKLFYADCLSSDNISAKFKDYCTLEIDEINDVLEKNLFIGKQKNTPQSVDVSE